MVISVPPDLCTGDSSAEGQNIRLVGHGTGGIALSGLWEREIQRK